MPTVVGGAASAQAEDSPLSERLTFYGDGRIRVESDQQRPSADPRTRGRLRFRAGARYQVTNDVRAEARLSTTSGDPNNPHWDFGSGAGGFDGSQVVLDRLFLKWSAHSKLQLQAGQFPHAFAEPPVMGEFVWDADVHPAGAAIVVGPGKGSDPSFDVRGVAYVAKLSSNESDPTMVGGQGNLYLPAGKSTNVQLSSSIMSWLNLDEGGGVPGNQGNTDPMADFLVLEGFLAVTRAGGPLGRTSAFVQAMHNLEDDAGEDTGWAAGLGLGPSGREGAWNVWGVYYDLDANCVFSAPAQDDTPISGTGAGMGMNGGILGVRYWLRDHFSIRAWGLTSAAELDDDPFRLRVDVEFDVR
jgi:hypothetical protein